MPEKQLFSITLRHIQKVRLDHLCEQKVCVIIANLDHNWLMKFQYVIVYHRWPDHFVFKLM